MASGQKDFGRRSVKPPPVITHAPEGLSGSQPIGDRRLRTTSIAVATLGVGSAVMLFALLELGHRSQNCGPPDDVHPGRAPCATSNGSSGGGHGGGGWSGSSTSSSSSSGSGAHGASFGGFGASGHGHGGGGE